MLHAFYKLGALQACSDAGLAKTALLSEVLSAAPGAVKAYAKTKAIGKLKGDLRQELGLPTPQWREAGGKYEIPEIAAQKVKEQVEKLLSSEEPPAPEPVKLPVVKLDLPPKKVESP